MAIAMAIGFASPSRAGAASIRVPAGENLSQIAHTYGTTVTALAGANGIADPNVIVAGTVLRIPTETAVTSAPVAAGGATKVVVASGDSLWTIATRYGITMNALARSNGITLTSNLLIGTTLSVPARPAAPNSGAGGTATVMYEGQSIPVALAAFPSRLSLLPVFQKWADAFGVPASLLEGTSWWESGWQMSVVSSTGAMGIGQLEPSTVATLRILLGNPLLSAANTSDNIEMAAAYLHQLLGQTSGNQGLALAGYYQGLSSVRQRGLLPSTALYVHGVLATTTLF